MDQTRRRFLLSTAAIAAPAVARAQSGDFAGFLQSLAGEARAAGVSTATFQRAIAGLVFDPGPVGASQKQSEFSRPFWDYVNGAASAGRISAGKAAAQRAGGAFDWIERNLGVGRAVVAGIWGMESNFGAGMGKSDVLRSTASLAFRQVRGDFYRREFIAALKILDEGHVTREGFVGSWAGAMGQPQFIPSSFLKYAIDADGDGRKDIWTNTRDALASAANHLKLDGWNGALPWGFEVAMPARFDWTYGDRTARHDFARWTALGVARADGAAFPRTGGAGLFLPAGVNGPAFLVTDNFEVIRQYNTSDSYAVGVGHLGDRIFGGRAIAKAWPTGEKQLSNAEISELQRLLQARGHAVGRIDGRIGQGTRKLVQIEQRRLGLVPDGHPSPAVLARLRGG
ncbi:MAG: lytic murein transglycosylase [Beijerinckiaceae bacterium]